MKARDGSGVVTLYALESGFILSHFDGKYVSSCHLSVISELHVIMITNRDDVIVCILPIPFKLNHSPLEMVQKFQRSFGFFSAPFEDPGFVLFMTDNPGIRSG